MKLRWTKQVWGLRDDYPLYIHNVWGWLNLKKSAGKKLKGLWTELGSKLIRQEKFLKPDVILLNINVGPRITQNTGCRIFVKKKGGKLRRAEEIRFMAESWI